MAAKKAKRQPQGPRRPSSGGGARHGEMPSGEMMEPATAGLMDMPSQSESQGLAGGEAAGQGGRAGFVTGVMPGEGPAGTTAKKGEMPGGGMSST